MEVTAKELRGKLGQIVASAAHGSEVVVTMRGKKVARLIPYVSLQNQEIVKDNIFGMWKDRQDLETVNVYVRSLRKGRRLDR